MRDDLNAHHVTKSVHLVSLLLATHANGHTQTIPQFVMFWMYIHHIYTYLVHDFPQFFFCVECEYLEIMIQYPMTD